MASNEMTFTQPASSLSAALSRSRYIPDSARLPVSAGTTRPKIFNLGDSRTGTTSIHELLLRNGFKSIHYFVRESGVSEPIHKYRTGNWQRVRKFIDESGYDAFSDHPTRLFFRELAATYPDAFFIQTLRKNVVQWRESMSVLVEGRPADLDLLQAYHVCYNEDIRSLFKELGLKFLEISIEDGAEVNARKICEFLGRGYCGPLLKLNSRAELREARIAAGR